MRRSSRILTCCAALVVASVVLPVSAQTPVETRYPELAAYSNTVFQTITALNATNFTLIHTQLLARLSRDTLALDEEAYRGVIRCRAARPIVDDPEELAEIADENHLCRFLRDMAFFQTQILWSNRFGEHQELLTMVLYNLREAVDESYLHLTELDARLTALEGVVVPPYFVALLDGPEEAAPGQTVELTARIWNMGDQPAEGLRYRLLNMDDRTFPKPAPISGPPLPAGDQRTFSFFVKVPDGAAGARFTFTVTAAGATPASRVHLIESTE